MLTVAMQLCCMVLGDTSRCSNTGSVLMSKGGTVKCNGSSRTSAPAATLAVSSTLRTVQHWLLQHVT